MGMGWPSRVEGTYIFYFQKLLRRRGLVVRVKIHIQEVVGSNPGPTVETINLDQKHERFKIVEK